MLLYTLAPASVQLVPLDGLFSLLEHVLLLVCVCLSVESVGLRGKLLRKVEELKSDSVCLGIPDEFLCPITRELMREPVIAAGKGRSDLFHNVQVRIRSRFFNVNEFFCTLFINLSALWTFPNRWILV